MKHFLWRTLFIAVVFFCCGCGRGDFGVQGSEEEPKTYAGQSGEGVWQSVDTAMGTVVQQTVYASEEAAKRFFEEAGKLLQETEQEELSWRLETSQVYQINASAGRKEGFRITEEMASLLEACVELHERSQGAFDVTLGPLTRLWKIDQWAAGGEEDVFSIPSGEEVEQALALCGSDRLRILRTDAGEPCLFLPEGMLLDLGAVGKGLAQARLYPLLEKEADITGAVISLGGSILTYGRKADGSNWKVGIVNPFDTSSNVGILSLEGNWCVSTSGDYERYVETDGVRYHHILDPETGCPAMGEVRGVTILTKEGLLGDGLSTACFILGPDQGMKLAAEYGAEVLFVMSDGEIRMSEGMRTCFMETL